MKEFVIVGTGITIWFPSGTEQFRLDSLQTLVGKTIKSIVNVDKDGFKIVFTDNSEVGMGLANV